MTEPLSRHDRVGPTVLVRPLSSSDAAEHFAAVRESAVDLSPFLPWCSEDYQLADSQDWVDDCESLWSVGKRYDFGVRNSADGAFLGCCSINRLTPEDGLANLGYWIRSGARGKGVAGEAARLVSQFGLEDLGLNRLEIVIAVNNPASLRVAEKLTTRIGAEWEGRLRKRLLLHGKAVDAMLYSVTSS